MRTPCAAARGFGLGLPAFLLVACQPTPAPEQESPQPIEAAAATVLLPVLASEPVPHDADDPAIWVHPTDPGKSLIFGTDKEENEGGLFVFDLDGRMVASVTGVNYPNNIDVTGPFLLDGKEVDLAVATERESNRLRILSIDRETGAIKDVSGKTDVFLGAGDKDLMRPMGVTLERTADGAVYAWLSRKETPMDGPLGRFHLVANGAKVDVGKFDRHGEHSGQEEREIEAMLRVPDGRVFYCEEIHAIRMLDPATGKRFAFAQDVFTGDREGLAYAVVGGQKLLFCSDQIEEGSELEVFDITGDKPVHVATLPSPCDDTDGIEVTTRSLGPRFPQGALVMMNSKDRNFLLFDLRDVLAMLRAKGALKTG